jgi:putative glutamine amidotransferase
VSAGGSTEGSGRRPVVGICAALHPAAWTVWRDVEANVSQRTYSVAVGRAGGLPLLLPADEASAAEPGQLLGLLDALILSGGADVDPSMYGAATEAETQPTNLERDRFEAALAQEALDRGLPLLAVCRGMELLNVVLGGTLEQHLAEADRHLHTPGAFSDHDVRLEPGSLAARAVGREHLAVRSHHHQGLATLGEGLVASGWSEPDGVIEAVELPGHPYALGVLWHPEEDPDSLVVASLVEAAGVGAVA